MKEVARSYEPTEEGVPELQESPRSMKSRIEEILAISAVEQRRTNHIYDMMRANVRPLGNDRPDGVIGFRRTNNCPAPQDKGDAVPARGRLNVMTAAMGVGVSIFRWNGESWLASGASLEHKGAPPTPIMQVCSH